MKNVEAESSVPAGPGEGKESGGPAVESGSEKDRPALSRRRLWAFRIASLIVVPLLFLSVLEGALRLAGTGYETSFFVPHSDRDAFVPNPRFGWRFFPRSLSRNSVPALLSDPKPAGTIRIFVLGGSAARGEPDAAFSFARVLRILLEARYPGTRFEMVNTAMTAINSHVVLPIARDCAGLDPDLFIVYLGNNEVVGPYGAGSVFKSYSPSLGVIRAGIRVKGTKLGQLCESIVRGVRGEEGIPAEWEGMSMFLENTVTVEDPRLSKIYGHFSRNLEDILETAARAGAGAVVCTVAVNLRDNAPFASLHAGSLGAGDLARWDGAYEAGVALEEAGNPAGALEAFEEAERIDDLYADLHFRMARCELALGKVARARGHFIRARELDALRFRADSKINGIIRKTAGGREDEGIRLVDAEKVFEDHPGTPNAIPGEEWFHEHVHLTFAGNHLLAEAVFEEVSEILQARPGLKPVEDAVPSSLEHCAELLGLTGLNDFRTAFRLRAITAEPPFTNQLDFEIRRKKREARLRDLEKRFHTPEVLERTRDLYGSLVSKHPEDLFFREGYAYLLSDTRRWTEAAGQLAELVKRVPTMEGWRHEEAKCRVELATELFGSGRTREGFSELERALALRPGYTVALYNMGSALVRQGKLAEGARRYRQVLEKEPGHARAHLMLGRILQELGRPEEAEEEFYLALGFAHGEKDPELLARIREALGQR